MARILIVDDEPIIALTEQDWLADLGHEAVGPAADLRSALAFAEQDLDAVVLDVSLGAETTLAVAERLRARNIPFAVASGHDTDMLEGAFTAGVALPKPFGFEMFQRVIETLLAKTAI